MPRKEFYEVQKLLGKRKLANNRVEYLVRWRGYSRKHDTWEPLGNLSTCMDLVQAFNAAARARPATVSTNYGIKTANSRSVIAQNLASSKRRRLIKPVKVYSPGPFHAPKASKVGIRSAPTDKSPGKTRSPSRSPQNGVKNLKSSRRRRIIQASPTRSKPSTRPKLTQPPMSPMSKRALDHFFASQARNFNFLNGIQTNAPHDHEYCLRTYQRRTPEKLKDHVIFAKANGNRELVKRTALDIKPIADGSITVPVRQVTLNRIKGGLKIQPRQIVVLKRGKCEEIIVSSHDSHNAFSPELLDELVRVLDDAAIGTSTLVLFRTVGDFFCSGINMKLFCQQVDSGKPQKVVAGRYALSIRNFVNCLIDFPKPLVAIVKGPAIGLGCSMLPHFDTVYCSERAYFALHYTDLSQTPEACSSYLFPKIVGHSLANDMLLNGTVISPIEAKAAGLVSQVLHHDSMDKNILPLVKLITEKSAEALWTTKELIRNAERPRLKQVNQCEYTALKERWEDPNTLKRIKNYFEKLGDK